MELWILIGSAVVAALSVALYIQRTRELARVRGRLEEAAERSAILFDNGPDAYFWHDMDGNLIDGNRAALELIGYEASEMIGRNILDLGILDPQDVGRASEVLTADAAGENPPPREYRLRRKDGSEVLVELRSSRAMLSGKPVIFVSGHDLTARKRAEAMATGLGRMLEESLNEIYVIDAETRRFVRVNRGARENLGYSMAELEKKTPVDLVDKSLHQEMHAHLDSLDRSDPTALFARTVLVRKNGSTYPAEVHIQRATLFERPVFEAFVLDITKREQAARALDESKQRLDEARRVARLGHWVWDVETSRIDWSDEVYDIVGVGRDEFDGTLDSWLSHVHPDDVDTVAEAASRLVSTGGHGHFDHRVVTSSGDTRYVQESGEIVETGTDGKMRVLGTVLDITARKRAELSLTELNQQLESRVAERTAELERAIDEVESFSYTISHDLRQPLRALDGYARFIAEDLHDTFSDDTRGYIERILQTVARMSAMIDAMLQLSRTNRAEPELHPTDLTAMIERIAKELDATYPERDVKVTVAPGMHAVCDANLLDVLLRNVLGNAYKFTAGRGQALIECGVRRDKNGSPEYFVSDNGSGFDMEFQSKLFAPFERLHREDEFPGTGVGLATSERIVRRHGGRIHGEGVPGEGAEFSFTLGPADAIAQL